MSADGQSRPSSVSAWLLEQRDIVISRAAASSASSAADIGGDGDPGDPKRRKLDHGAKPTAASSDMAAASRPSLSLLQLTKNPQRNAMRKMLFEAFSGPTAAHQTRQYRQYTASLATCVEDSVLRQFDAVIKPTGYSARMKNIVESVRKHGEVYRRLISGELTAEEVAKMTPRQLVMDVAEMERDKKLLHERKKQCMAPEVVPTEEEGEGAFQCSKCGSTKTRYTQIQIKSADEPMTIRIFCLNPVCGFVDNID